ncbi:MAG: hypothetical protein LIP16_04915 [Clostridium sp.]|nr:hypothetical protein [Clostridium sp.]
MRQINRLWKNPRAVLGLALVLAAVFLGGCSRNKLAEPAEESAAAEAVTADTAQAPNPMAEVEDPQAFEAIGVHMIAPANGKDIKYFIISGQVAEMQFTLDGTAYSWRASDTAEDFAGIFERFKEEVITEEYEDGSHRAQIEIKTTESGGRLASWAWGSTKYTLYTSGEVTDAAIKATALKLAELSENEK